MRPSTYLSLVAASLLSAQVSALDGNESPKPQPAQNEGLVEHEDLASIPIKEYFQVNEVVVTVQQVIGDEHAAATAADVRTEAAKKKSSQRHDEERARLLHHLSRSNGKWDHHHPRLRLLDALFSYVRYADRSTVDLDKWRRLYKSTSSSQKKLLEREVKYTAKLDAVADLIAHNQRLCDRIVEEGLRFYDVERSELDQHIKAREKEGKTAERIPISQALKHYVRDWATSGRNERDAAFPCILESLQSVFPDRSERDIKVLLPGSGVGRLSHDVAALGGFEVTSNEWSMFMNIAYRFLEASPEISSSNAHPFVDGWSHHATNADMFRGISFPDKTIDPLDVLLVEGDFTTAFKDKHGYYDAVVTHFFIDTARNLMSYFETIHALLPVGGYWVNFGPLLYGTGPWVQLSLEEVVAVVTAMGFEFMDAPEVCGQLTFEDQKIRGREAVYGFNERALVKNAYDAQSWVVRKVR